MYIQRYMAHFKAMTIRCCSIAISIDSLTVKDFISTIKNLPNSDLGAGD